MSIQGFNNGPLTYLTGATPIPDGCLATLTSVAGTVTLCGDLGFPIGIADGLVPAATYGTFRPLRGRVRLIASGAITAGDFVIPDAAGKVATADSAAVRDAELIGQAETTTTTDGDVVYVACPR